LGNLYEPAGNDITPDFSDPESPFDPSIIESEPSSPFALFFHSHGSNSSIEGSQTDSDTSFHTASRSFPSPSDTKLPLPPASSVPVTPVVYNPEINQALELSLIKSFELAARALCVKFSRDGEYFSAALSNGETHISDTLTASSKR
jgi:hypothetical protein